MTVYSSAFAKISVDGTNAVRTAKNIQLRLIGDNPGGVGSQGQTTPAEVKVAGNMDATGSFDFYNNTSVVYPGDAFTMVFHTGKERVTGTGVCESVDLLYDMERGSLIQGTATFGANGAFAFTATTTALTDTSKPAAYSAGGSSGCKAMWGPVAASPVYVDIADVRTCRIRLAKEVKKYNSSSTNPWAGRIVGAVSGCSVQLGVYQALPSTYNTPVFMRPADIGGLKVYVDATTFWEFKYLTIDDIAISAPVEGSDPDGIEFGMGWTGYAMVSGSSVAGTILKPDTTAFWP